MNYKEIKEARTKLLLDAQNILLANPDSEKRATANKMLADADILEQDLTSLDKIEKHQTEERSRTMPGRPQPGEATDSNKDAKAVSERRSFERYIKYGEVSNELRSNMEARDLSTNGASGSVNAGQFVPQSFYPVLTEAQKTYGNILNVIKQVSVDSGSPTKYAAVNDTGNLLSVVGETVAVSEVDPTISGAIISSDFLTTGTIRVSLAELQDSSFDLDAWIRDAFGKRYYRGLSSMVTLGSTTGNIGSLVSETNVGYTSAAPTAIAWADIAGTFASLDPAYEADAKWSMNATTRGLLLSVTDTLGRPLYVPAVTADSFDMILGKQVVINPFLVNAASTTVPVLYGDHSAYLLRNVRPGLSVMRLNERFIDQGEIGFVGFARSGGQLLQAGISPIVSLKMHV